MPDSDINLKGFPPIDAIFKLVDLLYACQTMARKATRDSVVRDLRETVPPGTINRDDQNDKNDIHNIVNACLNHSVGLETLVKIVDFYEEGSNQIEDFSNFVFQLLALEELVIIISEIDLTEVNLEELYHASLPTNNRQSNRKWLFPKNPDQNVVLSKVLSRLGLPLENGIPQENGIPAIFSFVEQLSISTNDSHGKLRKWVDDNATQFWGVSSQSIDALRAVLAPNNSNEPLRAYDFGNLNEATENKARFEAYKGQLKEWFRILGNSPLTFEDDFLMKMSEGMDIVENGYYDLIDKKYPEIDLTLHLQHLIEAKAYLNAALSKYEGNDKPPQYYKYLGLGYCRMKIKELIQHLDVPDLVAAEKSSPPKDLKKIEKDEKLA